MSRVVSKAGPLFMVAWLASFVGFVALCLTQPKGVGAAVSDWWLFNVFLLLPTVVWLYSRGQRSRLTIVGGIFAINYLTATLRRLSGTGEPLPPVLRGLAVGIPVFVCFIAIREIGREVLREEQRVEA